MSWILSCLVIFASALYSGLETGGYLLDRIRLRVRVREGSVPARRLEKVLVDAHLFIFTVLIGQNIAVYMVSREVTTLYLGIEHFEAGRSLLGFIPWNAETAATLTLMLPLFLLGEVFPKNLFRRCANTLMYQASIWLFLSWKIFYPVTFVLKKCFVFLSGGRSDSEASGEASLSLQGLRDFFHGENARSILNDHQHGMIDNLICMNRIAVTEIMTPVSSVVSVSEKETVSKALELMCSRNIDQLAVYSGSVRRIIGYLSLFDLMSDDVDHSSSVQVFVKKAVQISAHQSLNRAYRRLRLMPSVPLFVVDRPFHTVGRICLRDIAAYIVSEPDDRAEQVK